MGAEEAYRISVLQCATQTGKLVDAAIAVALKIAANAPLGARTTMASAQCALS